MYKVRLHAYACAWSGPDPSPRASEWEWVTIEMMRDLAFPAANRKLIQFLKSNVGSLARKRRGDDKTKYY